MRSVRPVVFCVLVLAFLQSCNTAPDTGGGPVMTPPPSATTGPRSVHLIPGARFVMATGTNRAMRAAVRNLSSTAVTFTSSNSAVATVNANGVVTAVGSGIVQVTATSVVDPTVADVVEIVSVPPTALHSTMVSTLINEVCPNEEEAFFLNNTPVTSNLSMIHEFHDCQRLINNGQYESLIGIFAHANVEDFDRKSEWREGQLAAVIINFKTKGNNTAYAPLALQPGTNCLILKYNRPRGSIPESWSAAVIQPLAIDNNATYGDCDDELTWSNVTTSNTTYDVKVQSAYAPDGGSEAPPVGRWDWDPVLRRNYMGVRCGLNWWCEIGLPGFTTSTALKTTDGRDIFKGFYDEQFLANENGQLSNIWGTLTPGADAIIQDKIKRDGQWYHVSTINMTISHPDNTPTPADLLFYSNKLAMAPSVTTSAATQTRTSMVTGMMKMRSDLPPGSDWQVTVNNQSVAGGWMTFRGHGKEGRRRFSTVRWRWQREDETTWTYCPEDGCCEMRSLRS